MVRSESVLRITALLLFLPVALSAAAQVTGGSISGTVSDPSEAVIPGVGVIIRNAATGVARTLVTNESGLYTAPNLLPGPYEITVTFGGFHTAVEKVDLTVGASVVVNVQLKMGSTAEQVVVADEARSMDLASSTLSNAVVGQTLRDLPLNGRDWTQLATLEPGVHTVDTQQQVSLALNTRPNRGLGTQVTFSGNRPQQNNYRLDGISLNDYSGGGPGSVLGANLGVDAIQEFSVVTSNASADYGKTSGGVFNAVTRSGTNFFHGSAYEFLRNSALDARNFFDRGPVPPFHRNQFGVSAGGPIRKDRTFVFGDYEGLRQSLSTTTLDTVPSDAARGGTLCANSACTATTMFNVDSRVTPYLGLLPRPNVSQNGDTGLFSFVATDVTTENFFITRLDHKFFDADSLHGAFMSDNSESHGPDAFDFILVGGISRRKMGSVEHSHIFSPSLVNFARAGVSRVVSDAPTALGVIDPRATDLSLGFVPGKPVGDFIISGLTEFGGGTGAIGEFTYHYTSYQVYDDLFLTRRNHPLKFGAAVERIQSNGFGTANPAGRFSFGSLRNFLLDQPTSLLAAFPGANSPIDFRQTVVGGYIQDDWRLRPNLTVNLGLRYEMATVPTERRNRLATLTTLFDTEPKLGSPYFRNPTKRDFSPRVGFAWDPFRTGKTSLRGAFGIYDLLPLTYLFGLSSVSSAPFTLSGSASGLPAGSFPTGAFLRLTPDALRVFFVEQTPKRSYLEQWNFNIQRTLLRDLVVQVGYTGSHGVHLPYRSNDADIVLPLETSNGFIWPAPGTGVRLNPNVGRIDTLAFQVSSSYQALNLRVTERLRKGLQLGGSYTWAKSIDTSSSSIAGGQFANSIVAGPLLWPQLRRGLSDFDVHHNFVLNYLWEVPGPRSAEGLFGRFTQGWELGGIFRVATGHPFTPNIGGDPLGLLNSTPFDFPDRVASPGCSSPVNPGNPDHYIKTECFVPPTPATRLGNSGRNIAEGPGVVALDVSLFKNNRVRRISESFNIQFRAEFFNALNHANFGPPVGPAAQVLNANLFLPSGQPAYNSGAGVLTTTTTTSRQIQFALKVVW